MGGQLAITGCPRSGTTLMLRMTHRLSNSYVFNYPLIDPLEIRFDHPKVLKAKREHPDKLIVTKLPDDLARIDKICKAGCKAIIMFRDGRDVLVSKFNRQKHYHVTTAERWIRDINRGLKAIKNYPDQIIRIDYKNLTCNNEKTMEQVANFVDRKVIKTFEQVWHKPLHKSSFKNWKLPKHQARASSQFGKYGKQIAKLLIQLGYESDDSWLKQIA